MLGQIYKIIQLKLPFIDSLLHFIGFLGLFIEYFLQLNSASDAAIIAFWLILVF